MFKHGLRFNCRCYAISVIPFLLILLATITCKPDDYSNLGKAILANCGKQTVSLAEWWTSIPDQTISPINADPVGGALLLFWIDEHGDVAHGTPGLTGQWGPMEVDVFNPKVVEKATTQDTISLEELKNFQEIPFNLSTDADTGFHLVQFVPFFWRDRATGKVSFMKSILYLSFPQVVQISKGICIAPVIMPDCLFNGAPSMTSLKLVQNPVGCMTRKLPVDFTLTNDQLAHYCLINLPHGLELVNATLAPVH
jgi:hypothetical protein